MSRYSSSSSTGHHACWLGEDEYEISWVVDFYYSGSRLRFPRRFRRDTNEAGAKRFCKKWKINFPEGK